MSSGFEICNYHTSHVQWLPEKAMKRNCNSLWGSLAAKRWCLAEQLCQTKIFSFLSWLFLYYCFFKYMMRTGTEDSGGSWQFEWINPTKMLLSSVKKLLFRNIPISKPLAQFSMYFPYTVKQVLFQGRVFQKLSHLIFLSANLAEYESALGNPAVLVFILKKGVGWDHFASTGYLTNLV